MAHERPALVIVDMQNYYLKAASAYWRYFNTLQPGCLDYIAERCGTCVIPNISLLLDLFRGASLPAVYLRLCGTNPDRDDLHREDIEHILEVGELLRVGEDGNLARKVARASQRRQDVEACHVDLDQGAAQLAGQQPGIGPG